ncbi:hypothetical protein TNCV_1366111 [Trichonephila clavipes]|nr:hypothetical protein TNCV_1366111 [Trichonephila clavipes]
MIDSLGEEAPMLVVEPIINRSLGLIFVVKSPFLHSFLEGSERSELHSSRTVVSDATVPLGLGSNPGEGMDVCKCIAPSRCASTLNSRRATSLLVKLMEGKEKVGGS